MPDTNAAPMTPSLTPPPQAYQKNLPAGATVEPTVPMFDSDGNIADIPQSRSVDASKANYKLGINMIGKDGSPAVIPVDRAHDAMSIGGYTMEHAPAVPMQETPLTPYEKAKVAASNWAMSGSPEGRAKVPMMGHVTENSVGDVAQTPVAGDIALGVTKGAGRTIAALAGQANKILPKQQAAPMTPEEEANAKEQLTPSGLLQNVGYYGEDLMEFLGGEEALKGLSVVQKLERLKEAESIVKIAEKSPAAARLIRAGIGNVIPAFTAGAQTLAHGGTMGEAAQTAAVGGTLGTVLGAGADYLTTKTPQAMMDAAKTEYTSRIQQEVDTLRAATGGGASDVENRALQTAKNAGAMTTEEGLNTPYNFDNAAFDIKASAKPIFEQLDKESNGLFQTTQNRLDNARKIIFNGASSIDALETAQKAEKDATAQMEKVFAASDINPDQLNSARNAWRKASTLEDLHASLDKAYSVPSGALTSRAKVLAENLGGESSFKLRTDINPKKFSTQLDNAVRQIGRKRLVDAIGDEGINELYAVDRRFNNVLASQKSQRALMQVMKAAAAEAPKGSPLNTLATGLLTAGGGAAIGAGYGALTAESRGESATAGALTGGTYGAMAGGAAGIPVAVAHFLYTHPKLGIKMLDAASRLAAPVASAGITHIYDSASSRAVPIEEK